MDYKQGKEDQIFFFNWDNYIEKTYQVNQLFRLETVLNYIKEFFKVFSEKEFDYLLKKHPQDYIIELTSRFTLANYKIYSLNHEEQ